MKALGIILLIIGLLLVSIGVFGFLASPKLLDKLNVSFDKEKGFIFSGLSLLIIVAAIIIIKQNK